MVRRFKLSDETVEAIRRDLECEGCQDKTGEIAEAPIFALIPLAENQVLVGVGGNVEEAGFREKALVPQSLISAAIFVGEGSHYIHVNVDGISISVKGKH